MSNTNGRIRGDRCEWYYTGYPLCNETWAEHLGTGWTIMHATLGFFAVVAMIITSIRMLRVVQARGLRKPDTVRYQMAAIVFFGAITNLLAAVDVQAMHQWYKRWVAEFFTNMTSLFILWACIILCTDWVRLMGRIIGGRKVTWVAPLKTYLPPAMMVIGAFLSIMRTTVGPDYIWFMLNFVFYEVLILLLVVSTTREGLRLHSWLKKSFSTRKAKTHPSKLGKDQDRARRVLRLVFLMCVLGGVSMIYGIYSLILALDAKETVDNPPKPPENMMSALAFVALQIVQVFGLITFSHFFSRGSSKTRSRPSDESSGTKMNTQGSTRRSKSGSKSAAAVVPRMSRANLSTASPNLPDRVGLSAAEAAQLSVPQDVEMGKLPTQHEQGETSRSVSISTTTL